MLIHDDTFFWDGFGGRLRLSSGKCKLRIFDMTLDQNKRLTVLRPIIVIVTDIAGQKVSIRSCAGHIATLVTKQFDINHGRMLWIEHFPTSIYGAKKTHTIPERFDIVEFVWHEGRALHPRWRQVNPPMLQTIKKLIQES